MIELVQSADAGKAKIVRLADRWSTWIVVIALTAAAGTWLVTGEIIRAVTILVVFCPCALVLATPTAIMAAIGNVTKLGVLVREGDALERLAKVRKVAFDKTGTLTYGRPEVVAVGTIEGSKVDEEQLYSLVASAESMSEHPLGKAVVRGWEQRAAAAPGEAATARPPQPRTRPPPHPRSPARRRSTWFPAAACAPSVAGRDVAAGNRGMLAELGVDGADALQAAASRSPSRAARWCSPPSTARPPDSSPWPTPCAPRPKPPCAASARWASSRCCSPATMPRPRAHRPPGRHRRGGGRLPPQNKLAAVGASSAKARPCAWWATASGDAPALKRASVGIAMGGAGSDIAVDAADIALVRDDIAALPHLLAISQRMMTTIKLNMGFSLGLNFVAIALAMTGILNPVVGALVHNAGSVIVIVNSALLRKWKHRGGSEASGDASPASAPGAATALRDLEPDAEAA